MKKLLQYHILNVSMRDDAQGDFRKLETIATQMLEHRLDYIEEGEAVLNPEGDKFEIISVTHTISNVNGDTIISFLICFTKAEEDPDFLDN